MTKAVFTGIERSLRKRVPLERGEGFTTVADGREIADIEITVDMSGLAHRLGVRAMENKNGCSKYLSGLVSIKVVGRKRVAS